MLATTWDNVNLRGGRRHERIDDKWEDTNKDYMTSMHFDQRVNVNHLENSGKAFKSPEELSLEDFILEKDEVELIFSSLIPLYSHSLLERHPQLFKSLKSSIKDHVAHQFQD